MVMAASTNLRLTVIRVTKATARWVMVMLETAIVNTLARYADGKHIVAMMGAPDNAYSSASLRSLLRSAMRWTCQAIPHLSQRSTLHLLELYTNHR